MKFGYFILLNQKKNFYFSKVKHSGVSHIPIQVSSQWTRTFDTISVNIHYRFNSSALPESVRLVNDIVTFYTIITDGQQINQSLPTGEW
jgi:hypothetical protein